MTSGTGPLPGPRRLLLVVLVLTLVAVGLLAVLLLSAPSQPSGAPIEGGEARNGVTPLFTVTGPGTGDRPTFDRPLGAAFGKDGRLYVSDTGNHRVCVFDRRGRFLFTFGQLGVAKPLAGIKATWKPGRLNSPAGIAVSESGEVYVADFRNDQICVFDAEGTYLRRFPGPNDLVGRGGSGQDGRGIAVTDVTVEGGRVYATDTYQVLSFTTEGEFVDQFGKPGPLPSDLDHPNGVASAGAGGVYVSDSNHIQVKAFDSDGGFRWAFGPGSRSSPERGETGLQLPRGLVAAPDGSILVADAFGHQIIRLNPQGELLAAYGSRGVAPGQFNFPNDVDIDGDRALVADKENDRVQVIEFYE